MRDYGRIRDIIKNAESIVFFGGAGVSTESGIPDFRSSDGIYNRAQDGEGERPEYILSHGFLMEEPERFWSYYRRNMLYPDAVPSITHRILAAAEKEGNLSAVITQNIDGLHQLAGSETVIELHGSSHKNYCVRCGKKYSLDYILETEGCPRCSCGGFIRPDVVMYGEGLDSEKMQLAQQYIENADVLIVGGTSLTVYPAAALVEAFMGDHLIIINRSQTPYDDLAEYVVDESLGEVMPFIFDM